MDECKPLAPGANRVAFRPVPGEFSRREGVASATEPEPYAVVSFTAAATAATHGRACRLTLSNQH